tara:strand:- start:74 stop:1105 length:1032 start_codon:yes stop_codon:yes gene_type:complete
MALWGKDDNLTSAGNVTLAYDGSAKNNAGAWVLTNSGSNFAAGDVGKVVRIGTRGGGGTYYGDAVIDTHISATKVTIASTEGLSTVEGITTKPYLKSELPISSVDDHTWSNKHDTVATYQDYKHTTAKDATAVGGLNIAINHTNLHLRSNANDHPDTLVNDGNNIALAGIGTAIVEADSTSAVGTSTLYVVAPPGLIAGKDHVNIVNHNGHNITVSSIASTSIGLAHTIASAVTAGDIITFTGSQLVSLASTVSAEIVNTERLTFQRKSGGYDKQIYGISDVTGEHYQGHGGKYRIEGTGWVGVTTYIDCHGKLRVKKETLVAIGGTAGITTGSNGIAYPTPV